MKFSKLKYRDIASRKIGVNVLTVERTAGKRNNFANEAVSRAALWWPCLLWMCH